jgi:hypothetical protein
MTAKRLPSFNDFSPKILKGDLRVCLAAVRDGGGSDAKVIEVWDREFFGGKQNKRSKVNIPATLRSTGLTTGVRPMVLSEFGKVVLEASSPLEAAQLFCVGIINDRNGGLLLNALASLRRRNESITKESLKSELKREGVTSLSTNTTDHTTLKNWMIEAQIIDSQGVPNDLLLKKLLGISASEADDWDRLSLAQQIFLRQLRREHVSSAGPFPVKELLRPCMEMYPDLFDPAQFSRQIQKPLVAGGWADVTGLAGGRNGGKSGNIAGTAKLIEIPIDRVIPHFDAVVPADLREKINTPLAEIKNDLFGQDTHLGGLALELLSLRMVLDLGLDPRNFRLRSAKSAHAEVDLIAEGCHLMFSRWTFQCKRYEQRSKVGLSEVAKEVGIALYVKAHVIVMVTTSDFSADAKKYAEVMSDATSLQFLFIDGNALKSYLTDGKSSLLAYARKNAGLVMAQKRKQFVAAEIGSDSIIS